MPIIQIPASVAYAVSPHVPAYATCSNAQKWKLEELRKEQRLSYPQLVSICRMVTGRQEIKDIGQLTPSEATKVRKALERKEYRSV